MRRRLGLTDDVGLDGGPDDDFGIGGLFQ